MSGGGDYDQQISQGFQEKEDKERSTQHRIYERADKKKQEKKIDQTNESHGFARSSVGIVFSFGKPAFALIYTFTEVCLWKSGYNTPRVLIEGNMHLFLFFGKMYQQSVISCCYFTAFFLQII